MDKLDLSKPLQVKTASLDGAVWVDVKGVAQSEDFVIIIFNGQEAPVHREQVRVKPLSIKQQLRENSASILSPSQFDAFWDLATNMGYTIGK